MGAFSIWHILIVLLIILLVFGAGKLPRLMGDFAKGIKAFKSGMKDGVSEAEKAPEPPSGRITENTAVNSSTGEGAKAGGENQTIQRS
jgi:sec-independent protein translocase protein TatA